MFLFNAKVDPQRCVIRPHLEGSWFRKKSSLPSRSGAVGILLYLGAKDSEVHKIVQNRVHSSSGNYKLLMLPILSKNIKNGPKKTARKISSYVEKW